MARALNRPWTEPSRSECVAQERDLDERGLVEQAKRERAAFATLYDRYLPAVYRYCYLRLGSKEAAEDATSIVFTKALNAISTCQPDRFRSWLFAIAHNVVVDSYRSRSSTEPIEQAAELEDPSPSPLDAALLGDDERTVLALLKQLSPEQREIVELRLAGLTGVEIAAALERSPGSVRAAQFRAYARLRELLGDRQDVGRRSR
jgi:RNA polymerase sigma-70 factor (ECF subfamily)